MSVRFCPIASGSSGNCIYLGTENAHILIDAGLSGKRIESGLRELGVTGAALSGIFVTHEHVDHISGVGVMSRKYKLPVFATAKTWRYFLRHQTIGEVAPENRRIVEAGQDFCLGDIAVRAFDIPHDSSEPVAYCVHTQARKIVVATDIGCVTDTLRENIAGADILLLESNHDIEMLKNGKYPKMLKDRVMGNRGHLSNVSAGQLLAETITERLRYVYLGHLSMENNRPLIALDTVTSILTAAGRFSATHCRVRVAERDFPSEAIMI